MTQQTTVDIDNINKYFPFHTLTDSEFNATSTTNRLSQSSMDRLSQLRLNP